MSAQRIADGVPNAPQFGWYQPRYLQPRDPATYSFPPLSKVLMSAGLNGDVSDEEAMKHRVAFGFAWERLKPIEEVWHGMPLDAKVPPAKDYERLLLLLPPPLPTSPIGSGHAAGGC